MLDRAWRSRALGAHYREALTAMALEPEVYSRHFDRSTAEGAEARLAYIESDDFAADRLGSRRRASLV